MGETDSKPGKTTWEKIRGPLGWTALLVPTATVVLGLASMVYTPSSSMEGKNGRKFTLFEHVVMPSATKAENRAALEESISKKMIEIQTAKKDSIAAVQRAHNDSIKAAMAKQKMKPRAQQQFQNRQVRMPQKH